MGKLEWYGFTDGERDESGKPTCPWATLRFHSKYEDVGDELVALAETYSGAIDWEVIKFARKSWGFNFVILPVQAEQDRGAYAKKSPDGCTQAWADLPNFLDHLVTELTDVETT